MVNHAIRKVNATNIDIFILQKEIIMGLKYY